MWEHLSAGCWVKNVEDSKSGHFIDSARLIAVLTLLSRVSGLFRDAVCSRVFGAHVLHYFLIPFLIPNLSRRLFGEGALSAALIPVYTHRLHNDRQGARLLASCVVSLLLIILSSLTLMGLAGIYLYWYVVGLPGQHDLLMLRLAAIMLPYMIFVCATAAIGAVLNVHRHFAMPAMMPIVLNLCIIAGVVFFRSYFGDNPWQQIYVVAIAVLVAGILQLVIQYVTLSRLGVRLHFLLRLRDEGLRKILRMMAPMVLGLAAVQINTLFDSMIAMFFSATAQSGAIFHLAGYAIHYPVVEGSVTYLNWAQRLYQLPLGIFGIALATAVFPVLSSHVVKQQTRAFSDTLNHAVKMVMFIALPATVGMIIIRLPLVRAVFEGGRFSLHDSRVTAFVLLFYCLGTGAYFLQHLVIRAFYAFQDSATPVKIAVRMVGLNFALNLILIWPLGTAGLALSTALCAFLQVAILLRLLIRNYKIQIGTGLGVAAAKTIIATVAMAIGGELSMYFLQGCSVFVQVSLVVVVCALLYIFASWLLKNYQLMVLMGRVKI